MSHHSLIEHVKSACFIVQSKEIKLAISNHTNKKSIIKKALRTKNSQGRVTDKKQYISMTNMNVCDSSKKQKPTSDHPSNSDQIEAIGLPIFTLQEWP